MKITYIHQYFNTPAMSGGTRSYEMARRLVAMGHDVNMVTSWREPGRSKRWIVTDEAGITVHWLPVRYSNHMGYGERVRSFLRFALGASRKAASLPADVVFATSTPLTIAVPGAYAAWRRNLPMVFEVRDLWPEVPIAMGALKNPLLQGLARLLERFAYRRSDAVVALSPGMRDGVLRAGYPTERITVIPNSADLERFEDDKDRRREFRDRLGIDRRVVLVSYTGTFGRVNGVDYLVRIASLLQKDARLHFLTVGDGQEYESVKSLARELGCLDKNFTMLPRIAKAEVPDVMAASDIATSVIVAVPELEANSANKFFDGLAAGRCVAINHGGWQADLLLSSGAGIQLDRVPQVAAEQLRALANEPERIVEAGRNARKLAEERFDRARLAVALERVLEGVLPTSEARTS